MIYPFEIRYIAKTTTINKNTKSANSPIKFSLMMLSFLSSLGYIQFQQAMRGKILIALP